MPPRNILGDHYERVKTDVRLPKVLWNQVNSMCKTLGVPKNAFFTISACKMLVSLKGVNTVKKGALLLKEVNSLLQKIEKELP